MLYKYQISQRSPFPFVHRWDVYEILPSGWASWVGRFRKYEDAVFYVDSRILGQIPSIIEEWPLDSRLNPIRSSLMRYPEQGGTGVAFTGKSSVRASKGVLEPMPKKDRK